MFRFIAANCNSTFRPALKDILNILGIKNYSIVGDTSGFKTDRKPVVKLHTSLESMVSYRNRNMWPPKMERQGQIDDPAKLFENLVEILFYNSDNLNLFTNKDPGFKI